MEQRLAMPISICAIEFNRRWYNQYIPLPAKSQQIYGNKIKLKVHFQKRTVIMNKLTSENVIAVMDEKLNNALPSLDTMIWLSYFLDFAISTEDIEVIRQVHDRTDKYYFDNFS